MADAADPDLDALEEDTSAPGPVLLRSDAEGVAGLTLNRPDQYNALSRELLGALQVELDLIKDDPATRVVVITGQGRAFCAGHDLKEIAHERERGKLTELFGQCSKVMLSLSRLPQPVIALVDGIATAAGCQLVAACDLALATTNARFATSGVKYGLFCSTPMVALSRNVSRKPAMEMLLTGDFIEADDAFRLGLVNKVVPPERLEEAFDGMVARLLDKPREVLALGKRAHYRQLEMGLEDAYAFTTDVIVDNALGRDFEEGLAAFLEKRAPAWPA
jgi:enoyl-CoA hydratase/carnithine racemase